MPKGEKRDRGLGKSILALVKREPGLSAWEITGRLGEKNPATVSCILKKLYDDRRVERIPSSGPRGGFTYTMKERNDG